MKYAHYRTCITPRKGTSLQGLLDRKGNGPGIADDLYLQILLLVDGRNGPLLLIQADLIGLDEAFTKKLTFWTLRSYGLRFGLKRSSVVFSCTHTHAGPSTSPSSILPCVGRPDPAYLAFLARKMKAGLTQVFNGLRPGQLFAGKGRLSLGINRRCPSAAKRRKGNGETFFKPNPKGGVDDELLILQIKGRSEEIVVVNYACHPVTVWDNVVSGDFPGSFARDLRSSSYRQNREALYLQGAAGDIHVPCLNAKGTGFVKGDQAQVRAFGDRLFKAVEIVLKKSMVRLKPRFRSSIQRVFLPFDHGFDLSKISYAKDARLRREWRHASRGIGRGKTGIHLNCVHWELAEACSLSAMGGEPLHPIGKAVKRMSGKPYALFLGYGDSLPGYVPTDQAVREGGYEIEAAFFFGQRYPFGKGCEQAVRDGFKKAMDELRLRRPRQAP